MAGGCPQYANGDIENHRHCDPRIGVGSQARGKQSMSRDASLILDCHTRFTGFPKTIVRLFQLSNKLRRTSWPGLSRPSTRAKCQLEQRGYADKVLGWCGPSSFERFGSSGGAPIRNCPAGITTISGHHGVSTSRNTVKSGSSRVSTLTPALSQRGPPGEGTSEFVAAIPLPTGRGRREARVRA
jgi:hypothetical protein